MTALITTVVLGLLISIIGIVNMTGNVSSLHWYHRQRVSEDNRKAFGKLVGIGTLLMGISLILFGTFSYLSELTNHSLFFMLGTVELIIGIALGLGLTFYAMMKYNKGIF